MEITSERVIKCEPSVVFEYISNFENNPIWQGGMIEATFTSTGPLGEGSTYDQVATFLGRKIITSFVVTRFERNRCIQIQSVTSTFPIKVTRSVKLADEGTLVSAVVEGDPGGLFKLAKPLLKRMVYRSVTNDYANLKTILENRCSKK
ncbi:SRPBCC family protein [Guptibacillus algicola]|uniref:SRPBCC family protein n=1 Tax=Guptibacillus algicola TaxID=225844 RepID=UPI001CD48DB8|nr:SRPBCC family protein [Alkalihalobacillus algicola]MCA0986764.1 SRPBCC family protein [Alkalihalobacillus algicola]